MNRRDMLQASAALSALAFTAACTTLTETQMPDVPPPPAEPPPPAPVARREPVRIVQLGHERVDDYQWMKDDNWQQVMRDPSVLRADIRTQLEAENAYTQARMAQTTRLQERIYQEMRGRTKEDDSSVPAPDGPWEYYRRFVTGAQHPIYARRARDGSGAEQILLDVDAMARGKDFFKVLQAEHSPDHALLAYAVDEQGSEIYTIYVKDLATGAVLPGPIQSSTGDFVWSPDSAYIFWTFQDDNGRPAKIYRRPSRGAVADDAMIYDEPDNGIFIGMEVSESRDYIMIACGNQEQSEYLIIPASDPTAAPVVFHARQPSLLYTPTHWNGRWYVLTNADGAIDFKVMSCPIDRTARAHWRDYLPHTPGRYVVGVNATKEFLVRLERVNALPRILVRTTRGNEHAIVFEEEAYDAEFETGYEFETSTLRFIYNSPTTPKQWFDYDMAARTRTLRKTQEIPSGHDPAAYEARRFFAPAPDGAQVPITVLMKRGQVLDGSAPMLLYGYGSYGITIDADFSVRRLSLVDRGWIYAIAHVRGGADMGFGWFLDGRHLTKKNTFTDFIACAEELVRRNYARAGNIVAEGRSAGGMLMGAITNMRPDLWAGVIGGVPFVDVLNTMSDTSLPLTPPEWPEWGNPIENEADYQYIASYSPYDNVEAKPYPAVLATGGLSDPRVTYWEPMKWATKLRAFTTSTRPVLLRMNMGAGHAGSAGRFEVLRELAHDYAFAIKAVGAAEAGGGF
jgi:oligopeptidase B